MKGDIRIGTLVRSKAGRDFGEYFIVASIINDEYVALLDGKLRKLGNEKIKKIKHIKLTGMSLDDIAAKLSNGKQLTDKEINTAIKNCINKSEVDNV